MRKEHATHCEMFTHREIYVTCRTISLRLTCETPERTEKLQRPRIADGKKVAIYASNAYFTQKFNRFFEF